MSLGTLNRSFVAAGLGLALLISGCTEYSQSKRVGTYTYEGVDYDVYHAKAETLFFEEDEGPQLILVPKGATPRASNVIASCYGPSTIVSKPCREEFGKVLRLRNSPDAPSREDRGMGY